MIGILSLQGDFAAHRAVLEVLGAGARAVRRPADLEGVAGLILPGGESTTMLRFLTAEGLRQPLLDFAAGGRPVFGTCAGLILMARRVSNPVQESLGLLDVAVERNGYGRQVDSFIDRVDLTALEPDPGTAGNGTIEGVFIRAPLIREVGEGVRVLGTHGGRPVLVQQGMLLASTFHPELTGDGRIHRAFLALVNRS